MAFEYDGIWGSNEAYYEPNSKGYSQYDIDLQRKRFAEQNEKHKKIMAFVLGASLLIAFMLVVHDKCIKKHPEKTKTESVQPKENKVINTHNALKIRNFIRQR